MGMNMVKMVYLAAVLGDMCAGNAAAPAVIASALANIHGADRALATIELDDCQRCEGDLSQKEELYLEIAMEEAGRLKNLGLNIELHYNEWMPVGIHSRLRIEIPGTRWDSAAPLYIN